MSKSTSARIIDPRFTTLTVTGSSTLSDVTLGDVSSNQLVVGSSKTASTGPGTVPVTSSLHEITADNATDPLTLADGTDGQVLMFIYVAESEAGDSAVLTPATFASGNSITFADLGQTATLLYSSNGGWYVTALNGAVLA